MALVRKAGSDNWHMNFVFHGQRYQRSTNTANRREAQTVLEAFRTALNKGEVGITEPKGRCSVSSLLDKLQAHYEAHGKASVQNLSLIKRAKEDFGSRVAHTLKTEELEAYAKRRLQAGAAKATCNRITGILRCAFKLSAVPFPQYKKLSEADNVREGFFTPSEMQLVLAKLPNDGLRDFVRFCHATGTRTGEAKSLLWSFVQDGQIRIPGQYTKTRKSRSIPIEGEIAEVMAAREAARSLKQNGTLQIAKYIFHRGDGQRIGEFRKSWATACKEAGLAGRTPHDLRRSAARDLIRSGVPQSVAMSITGHKTDSMFRRYDITDDTDTREALRAAQLYRQKETRKVAVMPGR
ncbi:MAG TPA: site-specific integrase [Candidatus Acidoferrum sp.]|jgi:integrase